MAKLAFFGTPAFANGSLQAVLDARQLGHDVVVVVCQPDKPKGRGQKLEAPPVKELALAHGIAVAQPTTLKAGTPDGEEFYARFAALDVDLAVVAAYGRILPKRLLALPKQSFVNVHASLLPRWRGAAPIQRAIEAGDAETGVCLMHMVYELDAGDVYAEARMPIDDVDDGETLTPQVAALGGALLAQHLPALIAGTLARSPQPAAGITYAHMLKKEEARIDWSRSARAVVNHARAMMPWPGVATELDGAPLKLFAPRVLHVDVRGKTPGAVIKAGGALAFAAADLAVVFDEVQPPNKRRMSAADYLRGRRAP